MKFTADKISIRGPLVDGGWKVTLDVGEFEKAKIAGLFLIPSDTILEVEINGENL